MDECFEALANIHRRRVLVALLDHEPQQDHDPIRVPEDIHEGETPVETLRKEFYHSHLPRLEDTDFIRWDRDTDEVMQGARFDEIRPLLEAMRDRADEFPDDVV